MKDHSRHIPAILLVAEAVYLSFVPITIAHSIILFSLAGLFAFNQFLTQRQEEHKLQASLAKAVEEFKGQLEKHKELYDKQLSEMKDEVTKVSLNSLRASSPSSPAAKASKQYQF